ncbi:10 kDa heat shock protein, mitochondrial-like [Meriones unguiculatus]|uniref:10 kDa heat shock protein, mitochondrial-like n=1 Tax=Meriones unguiculatus TaxID=10047 RepID=UPI00293EFA9E|nr:10 kDa heat shock protein, mitochondrial-like [Meriones unguiculatus]
MVQLARAWSALLLLHLGSSPMPHHQLDCAAEARCRACFSNCFNSGGLGAEYLCSCGSKSWLNKLLESFLPLFDRVLVEKSASKTGTKDGIMLPENSQGKLLQATVVSVGSGVKAKDGEIQQVSVKVGDKVLLPEYGDTKVFLGDKVYFLIRDCDILGKYVD